MLMLNIKFHNITVLDFNSIFNQYIETDLINDLDKFGLIKDDKINIKNKDVKKFFYHHIIYGISKFYLESKIKNKSIIFYTESAPVGKEILSMSSTSELQSFMDKTIVKISKLLPLKWFIDTDTFDMLVASVKEDSGSSTDVINRLRHTVYKYDTSKFTYARAKSFAKRYELNFLTSNFFQKVYAKQLILS